MKAILTLAIIVLSIAGTHLYNQKDATIAVDPKKELPSVIVGCDTYAHKLFCLTNEERSKSGMKSLLYSPELEEVSRKKSQDMCNNDYFSHDYNGERWTKYIKQSDVNYHKAAENLARNYSSPEKAMQGLIDSPKHYEAILGDYTHVGIYTEECGGKMLTTQTFAKL